MRTVDDIQTPTKSAIVAQSAKGAVDRVTTSGELGRPFRAPICSPCNPRALPWATVSRTVGAPIYGAPMDSRRCFDSFAPKGHSIVAQGNALGLDRGHTEALKGRPNLCGASSPSGNRLSQREEGMA